MADLLSIYVRTLGECHPARLIAIAATEELPRNVVAIGKCAGPLLDGFARAQSAKVGKRSGAALAITPLGYPPPREATVIFGGHPGMTDESFHAGAALIEFVERHEDITFLISGGGSACVEWPLEPWFTREDVQMVNERLLASGLPIGEVNTVRRRLSAIKGGRLAARVRGMLVSLIYSDVSTGALADVASGPTLSDATTNQDAASVLERVSGCDHIVTRLRDRALPETVKTVSGTAVLIADNSTLTLTAARICREAGLGAVTWPNQIETSVEDAAASLIDRALTLGQSEVLVAGGEPTVVRSGKGAGGRCSEMAVRFALAAESRGDLGFEALFGSSDGVDGNSGASGIYLPRLEASPGPSRIEIEHLLSQSDSFNAARRIGVPIALPPTGNNLRDLFLVRRRAAVESTL